MGNSRTIFSFSFNSKYVHYNFLPGFKPQTSGIRSDRPADGASTTAHFKNILCRTFLLWPCLFRFKMNI